MTGDRPQFAMVFAAGRGERMRPLSDVIPKPALPVPDHPVIAAPIRLAVDAHCRSITINTWHLADLMESAVRDSVPGGTSANFSREQALMGTAGGLAAARDRGLLGHDGPVLVVNGDCLLDLSLDLLFDRFTGTEDRVTLGLLPHPDPSRWSRVLLDADGLVAHITPPGSPETSEVPFLYPGAMVVSRNALAGLATKPHGVGEGLWAPARTAGKLGGVVLSGDWKEVGTPADYLDAVLHRVDGRPCVDSTAQVEANASIGAAFIGRDARVKIGAVIDDSIVAEGAEVRRDARVIRSILLGPVHIAEGESVVDEVRTAPLRSTLNVER